MFVTEEQMVCDGRTISSGNTINSETQEKQYCVSYEIFTGHPSPLK